MTPKEIILDTIKTRFEPLGITKLIFTFNIQNDTYNVMLQSTNEENVKMNIEKKEITLLKFILVNKIKRKYEKERKEKLKSIIIQFEMSKDTFDIFTENEKGKVYKFEY